MTTHTLYHTFRKNLVNVATPLDHESIKTVGIYITPSEKDREKAVRQASGELLETKS